MATDLESEAGLGEPLRATPVSQQPRLIEQDLKTLASFTHLMQTFWNACFEGSC